jgi:uncharacterized membrane protein YphA (DoxX/SURF4 family)
MMLVRQFAIVFSIAILYPMLVYYGVRDYQPLPEFQYYVVVSARVAPTTPEGWKVWEEENRAAEKKRQEDLDAVDKATQPFFRALILVATPLGIAVIFIGSYLRFHSIGMGLIFGGIFSITNAYWGYWNHLDDWIQYLSLLLGFCLLVFVGYRQFAVTRNNPT